MARPKKDKQKEEIRIAAKKKRLDDERAITNAAKEKEPAKKALSTEDRLDRLEFIIRKMAHHNGLTKIITEAGFEAWVPGKKDMTRWKNEVKDK